MRKSKKIIVILLASIFLIIPGTSVFAAGDPVTDIMESGDVESNVIAEYKTPFMNYGLDFHDGWGFDGDIAAVTFIVNVVWLLCILITRLAIILLQQAYSLDLINGAVGYLDDFINSINSVTWDVFATVFIAIALIVAFFNLYVSYKRSKAFEQIGITFLIIVLAIAFFANPAGILSWTNNLSKQISGDVLSSTIPMFAEDALTLEDSLTVVGNALWRNHVEYPWYMMEFGTYDLGVEHGDEMLSYSYGSDDRKDLVKELRNDDVWMLDNTMGPALARLILSLFFLIFALANLILIGILSFLMLIMQVTPLILMSLCGIVFLVSLVPNFGFRIIEKWFARILGALFYKVLISILLSIYLVLISLMFQIYGDSILSLIISIIVVVIMIVLERKGIIGMFTAIKDNNPQAAAEAAGQKVNFRERLSNRVRQGERGVARVLGAAYTAEKVGQYHKKYQKNKLGDAAQDHLKYRYQQEKDRAEYNAYKNGGPVQYSDFVNQVNKNKERGLPLFTGEQIDQTKEQLYDIKKQGGNIDQVFLPTGVPAGSNEDYTKAALKYREEHQRKRQEFEGDAAWHYQKASFAQNAVEMGATVEDFPDMNRERKIVNGDYESGQKLIDGNTRIPLQSPKPVKPRKTTIPPEISKRVSSDWNSKKGKVNQAQFVSDYKAKSVDAHKQLQQLKLYEGYEKRGELNKLQTDFPKIYDNVTNLKNVSGQNTQQLVKSAQKNFDNTNGQYKAAQNATGFKPRSFVVTDKGRKPVKSVNDFTNKVLTQPTVSKIPNIKNDQAFKQSVINDWTKHEDMGYSQKEYLQILNNKRKESYSQLKTFNTATESVSDSAEKSKFEDAANRMRHLYVHNKMQYQEAEKMFGIKNEKQSFRRTEKSNQHFNKSEKQKQNFKRNDKPKQTFKRR